MINSRRAATDCGPSVLKTRRGKEEMHLTHSPGTARSSSPSVIGGAWNGFVVVKALNTDFAELFYARG